MRFFKYVFVGVVSAAIYIGLNVVLSRLIGSVSFVITAGSFVIATVVNYVLHYHLTFQSTEGHNKVLGRFTILVAVGALASGAVNTALGSLGLPVFWSSVIFLGLWVMVSYRLASRYVFQ